MNQRKTTIIGVTAPCPVIGGLVMFWFQIFVTTSFRVCCLDSVSDYGDGFLFGRGFPIYFRLLDFSLAIRLLRLSFGRRMEVHKWFSAISAVVDRVALPLYDTESKVEQELMGFVEVLVCVVDMSDVLK